jgi:hypothetical protein
MGSPCFAHLQTACGRILTQPAVFFVHGVTLLWLQVAAATDSSSTRLINRHLGQATSRVMQDGNLTGSSSSSMVIHSLAGGSRAGSLGIRTMLWMCFITLAPPHIRDTHTGWWHCVAHTLVLVSHQILAQQVSSSCITPTASGWAASWRHIVALACAGVKLV